MKTTVLATAMLALVSCGWGRADEVRTVRDFRLTEYRGSEFSLSELSAGKKAVVICFLGVDCPLVKRYSHRLSALAKRFGNDVSFVGINSNQQDSLAEMGLFAKEYKVTFPMLRDPGNAVADEMDARRTPEVFVLDAKRTIRYRGRIDDQYEPGVMRPKATRDDLAIAIDEIVTGKEVSVASTPASGCFIGRVKKTPSTGEVTYASHVAAILQRRCMECHREGEIGPMELTSYDSAVAWSDTIAEVIDQGRMPPWFADPKHGRFLHDPTLSSEEKETIRAWVTAGCPEGDRSQAPANPTFTDGWLMQGKPDVVYHMSDKPFSVPAEGEIQYQYYTIDPGFTEDKWILGAEARPGNRSVVHHILVFCNRPGKFYPPGLPGELISAYAPGMQPTVCAQPNMALLIPKGSKIIMQLHYTANGRPQEDLSYFGLKFFPDPSKVEWELRPGMAINVLLRIPAFADNHRVPAMFKFGEDSLLLGVNPHMHMRGKSFVYEAVYPDGRRETIMNCPKYDFNWQLGYQYAEPLKMPKGTTLACTAHFDNSTNNPSNPDPSKVVTFGDQTWDEMMIGWFYYAVRNRPVVATTAGP
jgi:peroxiredoxin